MTIFILFYDVYLIKLMSFFSLCGSCSVDRQMMIKINII